MESMELRTREIEETAIRINLIKAQAQRFMLSCAMEVGRELLHAKSLLPHGEWGDWLKQKVNYSKSTANNLMKIYEEFGSRQETFFEASPNLQALGDLSYTKAVALLGVGEDEREEILKEHSVEELSTREFDKIIKEKRQLEQEKKETEEKVRALQLKEAVANREKESLKKEKEDVMVTLNALKNELQEEKEKKIAAADAFKKDEELEEKITLMEAQGALNDKKLESKQEQITQLEQRLKELLENPIEVTAALVPNEEEIEKIRQEEREKAQKEVEDAAKKCSSLEKKMVLVGISTRLEKLQRDFWELKEAITAGEETGDLKKKLLAKVQGILLGMAEEMK